MKMICSHRPPSDIRLLPPGETVRLADQRSEPREGPRPIPRVFTQEQVTTIAFLSAIHFSGLASRTGGQTISTSYYNKYHLSLRPRKSIYTVDRRTCPKHLQS